MESRPVFVTGGSGFLGRELLRELVRRGERVRALVRSDAAREVVRRLGAQPVHGGLHSIEAMERGMHGCSVVFHCAALTDDWGTRTEHEQVNVVGTRNVCAAALAAGVDRVVHVSTEAVLAGGRPIRGADETWPLPERPLGLYPWSKGLAEGVVADAVADGGLDAVIVRPRFIWGVGDSSVLPRIEEQVREGRFRWIGGGDNLTSTCHVRNVVEGLLAAAERGRSGEIYFLTDGEPVVMRTFLSGLLVARGLQPPLRTLPRWAASLFARAAELLYRWLLPGSPPITRTALALFADEVTVSDAKARSELGYEALVSVAQGTAELAAEVPDDGADSPTD